MEYTELELNKMIAELEGVKWHEFKNVSKTRVWLCTEYNSDADDWPEYNVLTDWNLLGPLMFKYEVEIHYDYNNCVRYVSGVEVGQFLFKNKSEIPRAIIMCILKSKNII
tara:strand:+ start:52 stop:381 length:330 start_codon:yes stop_codon:yes gene_type:complete